MWTLPAPIVTAENAWAAYYGSIPTNARTTAQSAATLHYLRWKESNAEQTSTDSRDGASLTSSDIRPGDTVRISIDGKVDSTPYGDHVDVVVKIKGEDEVICAPKGALTVIKKAAPPEPAVGAIIAYYDDKWLHTSDGWKYLPNSGKVNAGKGLGWHVFEHDAVKLMSVSPYFLISR